jgi:hypothetical protein
VRERFSEGVRYARGAPLGMESLLALVERGPMLRRSDIILALSARTRGAYDVEPRAFTGRQREMMTAGRTAAATAPRA